MSNSGNFLRRARAAILGALFLGIIHPSLILANERLNYSDLKQSDWDVVVQTGQIKSSKLKELSGLARSHHFENHFWGINDSGNKPFVYLLNQRGEVAGQVELGEKNIDWEDLVSFQWQGKSYLAVADVGDNRAKRSEVRLLIIPEPTSKKNDSAIVPVIQRFVYEDGARDCEAVGFSSKLGQFILVSKRDADPHLYRLPIDLQGGEITEAKFLTQVTTIPQPSLQDINNHKYGLISSQPTALDIAPDDSGIMIQTYKNAYWYTFNTDWKNTLLQKPELLKMPRLKQTEAMAFNLAGDAIYIASEGRNSPVMKVSAFGEQ